jgi:hypothetical protein|tara:strand:- start:1055 stop:3247 length:2193 start_codon:yes stop_codon:yes gene_type:complete
MSTKAFAPDAGAPKLPTSIPVYAVDFETTYDNECSIRPLGWDAYFRHELFECYLVAIKGSDGFEWVGHPKDAPWDSISHGLWISHNASFDQNLYLVAKEEGWWGDIPVPDKWHCTSDMVAFLGYPRSLKDSCKAILGADLSKAVRTNMIGLRPPDDFTCVNTAAKVYWKPMTDDFWKDVLAYALDDSVYCLKLWQVCSDRWSEQERWLSDHTRVVGRRGIPVDIDKIQAGAIHLRGLVHNFEGMIPWLDTDKLLSRKAFDRECLKNGVTPPVSLAQDNPDTEVWLQKYEGEYTWVMAFRSWRRVNSFLKKVEAFERASRVCADGVYRYFGGLMYCGAHTHRWSGGGGNLNLQNLPRGEMFGVNIRSFIVAPPGYKILATDLSQIEVRTTVWLSKDQETLDLIEETDDFYEAFAIKFGLWSPESGSLKKNDPDLRHLVKQIVLGSGYGASPFKFAIMAKKELSKAVNRNLPEGTNKEAKAFSFLAMKQETRTGLYFWRRCNELLANGAECEVTTETKSGSFVTKVVPQVKAWNSMINKLDGTLESDAPVPISLEEWDWDADLVLVYAKAEECVNLFRDSLPAIPRLWKSLTRTLGSSVMDKRMEFILPSGNKMQYRNLVRVKDEVTKRSTVLATIVRTGRWSKMRPWHGSLTENLSQSLARDVFGYQMRKLEEAGHEILFHVHDEVVEIIKDEDADAALIDAEAIMSTAPTWIASLPLDAEGTIMEHYKKG